MAVSIMDHIGSSGGDGMAHLKNGIRYILNPLKTGNGKYAGTVNCFSGDPLLAYDDFIETKKRMGKLTHEKGERQGYHFVLSFAPEDEIDESTCMKFAEEFIREYLGERFEAVYAVHNDRHHLHIHIIFNSVSVADGYKYHDQKGTWEHVLQPIVNRLCEKYQVQPLDFEKVNERRKKGIYPEHKSYNKWEAEKEGHLTWAELIRRDIDEGILINHDVDNLFEWLKTVKGYAVKCGKHISYRPPGKERFLREGQLGAGYFYHDLIQRISDLNSGKTLQESLASFRSIPKIKGVSWQKQYSSFVWRTPDEYKKYVRDLYREGRLRVLQNSDYYHKEALARFRKLHTEMQYINHNKISSMEELEDRLKAVNSALLSSNYTRAEKADIRREKKLIEGAMEDFGQEGGKLSAEFHRNKGN